MSPQEIADLLKTKFGDAVLETKMDVFQPWAMVQPSKLAEIGKFLRDDPQTKFDFLRNVAAVDYKTELELVYHLFSYAHRHEFKLKVRLSRETPSVGTVEQVWPAANWHEREAFDLMGIHFEGHRDLRRLLLPDDWIGHPLRKDYKEQDMYRGVSTTREYIVGMMELPTLPPIRSEDSNG